jgi:hypothetical protein
VHEVDHFQEVVPHDIARYGILFVLSMLQCGRMGLVVVDARSTRMVVLIILHKNFTYCGVVNM